MPWASSRRSVSISRAWSWQLDELDGPQLVALEPLPGQPEAGDERDDALLDAVVQVALDPSALGVLGRDEPDPRGGELLELLAQAGGEPDVRHRRRGLPRHRAEEGELGHVVAPVPSRSELQAAEALGAADEVLGRHGIPDEVADDGRRRCHLPARAEHADPHPRRVEAATDAVGEAHEHVVELHRLLEPSAELAEEDEVVVAVPEHRPLDRALHPPADRQQHDRGDARSASRRPTVCSWSKKSRAGVVMPIA